MTSAAACRLLAGRHRPKALTFRDLPAEEQEAGSVRPPRFLPSAPVGFPRQLCLALRDQDGWGI